MEKVIKKSVFGRMASYGLVIVLAFGSIGCGADGNGGDIGDDINGDQDIPDLEGGGVVWTLYWGTPCTMKTHDYITKTDEYTDVSGMKEHRWIFRQNGTDLDVYSFFDWCNEPSDFINAGSIVGDSLSLNIYEACSAEDYCKAQGLGKIDDSGAMVSFDTLWQFCKLYAPEVNIAYYQETRCSATFAWE